MKRLLFLFAVLSNLYILCAKNDLDSINSELKATIENKQYYVKQKEEKIQNLKQAFALNDISLIQEYEINKRLSNEYEKFVSDSAIYYLNKNLDIAKKLNNTDFIYETQIHIASLYSTTGQYIESKKMLESIDSNKLNKQLLILYYEASGYFCDHYGQSNTDYTYYTASDRYRDSLLTVLDPISLKYQIVYAEKIFYKNQSKDAEAILLRLLNLTTDENTERALISYLLGIIYKAREDINLQKKYFSISAITDLKNAIKDNASQQSLALVYYNEGNIDLAYKYMKSSLDDAVSGNIRYRASESTAFYPIINAAYQTKEATQKDKLRTYLILISFLSVFLIVAVIYVYKQMRRLSKIRKELYRTNVKLNSLNNDLTYSNEQLKDLNNRLLDANHIKEEYIAHFFDLCSAYINKMEEYRKSLNKKVINKQFDELYKTLKSNTFVDSELEDLYHQFDTIFLNIYPTFIEEFNSLLVKEEYVLPKQGELLNTELRVFALIRLGITDSVKIAGFLRYSLSTIYNYRTKARNKAAVSRDDFEKLVMKIGTSQLKDQ